jgi:hypothetical protein
VRAIRSSAALFIGLLAVAGCGGGGEKSTTTSTAVSSAPSQFESTQTVQTITTPPSTATTPTTTQKAPTKTNTSPEDQPGGAGDETPIATQALFTANGGRISPARVRVPPFIAVRVVLQAKDAKAYTLIVGGKEVAVGEGRTRASVRLDGLRPGARYVAHNQFGNKPAALVIVANAEPGP